MSVKSNKTKYIAVVLVVVVIGAFLVFRGMNRFQTDEASQLMTKIKEETKETSSLWKDIELNMADLRVTQATYDAAILSSEIDYAKTARSNIAEMENALDSIRNHDDKAVTYLQELKDLKLPDWGYEYADLITSILEKDRQRVDKSQQMLDNVNTFYKFSEEFLAGLLVQMDMEEALKDGAEKALDKDYAGAKEQFEKALDFNSQVKDHVSEASNVMHFNYLDRIESNREKAKEIIEKFIESCDLAIDGAYTESREKYEEADEEYRSLNLVYLSDLKPENSEWWKQNVESIYQDIRQLTNEIEDLEHQAESLIEK